MNMNNAKDISQGLNRLLFRTHRLIPKKKRHLIEFYVDQYKQDGIYWKFDYENKQYKLFYSYKTKKVFVECCEKNKQSEFNAI